MIIANVVKRKEKISFAVVSDRFFLCQMHVFRCLTPCSRHYLFFLLDSNDVYGPVEDNTSNNTNVMHQVLDEVSKSL